MYYIGEFDDDASKVSMPILNEAGIPQVSPANTDDGLTTNDPGSGADQPKSYAPTGARTYLRIVPSDSVQTAALLLAMKQAGCTKSAVVDDRDRYGAGLAGLIGLEKGFYAADVVSITGIGPSAAVRARVRDEAPRRAPRLRRAGGGSLSERGAADHRGPLRVAGGQDVRARGDVHGLVDEPRRRRGAGRHRPADRAHPVTRGLTAYPGGRAFAAAYEHRYGLAAPSPCAILGYEAMRLGLSTIARARPRRR